MFQFGFINILLVFSIRLYSHLGEQAKAYNWKVISYELPQLSNMSDIDLKHRTYTRVIAKNENKKRNVIVFE